MSGMSGGVDAADRDAVAAALDAVGVVGAAGPRRVERLPTAFHRRDSCGCGRPHAGG